MPSDTPVQFILGTHTIGDTTVLPGIIHIDKEEDVKTIIDTYYNRGYRAIDTARNYPGSEERLGNTGAPTRFTIHSKVLDGPPGSHEPAKIEASINKSLSDLQTSSLQTMFLHVPDRQTSFENVAAAINKAYEEGKFKQFGLSNYTTAEVQEFINICEENGYVKPTVYQGHYNAVVRGQEREMIPLARKYNMAFFAYSPAAGGLFTGNAGKSPESTRWNKDTPVGQVYQAAYGKSFVEEEVAKARAVAEKHGISGHAAALRWTAFHSQLDGKYGDAVLFGARNIDQLNKTLDALESGPLPQEVADALSAITDRFEEGEEPDFHL